MKQEVSIVYTYKEIKFISEKITIIISQGIDPGKAGQQYTKPASPRQRFANTLYFLR